MFSSFKVSQRGILGLFLGLALGTMPLLAQLDPKLQTVGPSFLDLYQPSQNLVKKPEVVTVFDFSGSMASTMYHKSFVWPTSNDTGDSDSTAGMSFVLTGPGNNTATYKDKYGTNLPAGRYEVKANITSGVALTNGILIRPDGSKLEYATGGDLDIKNNYQESTPLLGGENALATFNHASDVRNWIRCASHVRFTSSGKTFDLPICWTILDHPSVQPNVANGEFRKMYNTYPLKMTIINPVTNTEIEMDTTYRVASQVAGATTGMYSATVGSPLMTSCTLAKSNQTTNNFVGWKSKYLTWLFSSSTTITQSSVVGGQAFNQSLDQTIVTPSPNKTVVADYMIPARTRTQGVKDAALRTWAKYYNKVFWAYRFLKYFQPDSSTGQAENAVYPSNDSRNTKSVGNPTTTPEFGCSDRGWVLLNINSDTGLKRLAALLSGGSTPLNSALANTYTQLNDPNNIFNDIETGDDKPVECRNTYVMLFTDGAPNTDPGTPLNTNTPYIGLLPAPATATSGSAKSGNDFFNADKTRINTAYATPYFNVINLAALAAHGGDLANGGWASPTYPATTEVYPAAGSKLVSQWIPFWIKERGSGVNRVIFSKPRAITTMTIGVGLTGLITDGAAPKRRLFLAGAFGDPSRTTWDVASLTEFTLADPDDSTKGKTPDSIYYFDATDPGKLTKSLDAAFAETDLNSNINVTSNPNLPFIGAAFGKQVYLGKFQPPSTGGVFWPGDLFMFATKEINNQTVFINSAGNPTTTLNETTAQWAASTIFVDAPAPATPKWKGRKLYTRIPGTAGVPEPGLTVFSDQGYVASPGVNTAPYSVIQPFVATAQVLNSDRRLAVQFSMGGDITKTLDAAGRPDFTRKPLLGDIIDSSPNVIEYNWDDVAGIVGTHPRLAAVGGNRFRLILVGTNQGWLHAFGEVTKVTQVPPPPNAGVYTEVVVGAVDELWAFMPTDFLSRIDYLTSPANTHRFMVDGTPVIYHLDLPPTAGGSGNGVVDIATERAVAIFGLRKGGRSYYALDIHDPFTPTMKWSVVPDEYAVFPSTRTVTGGVNQATVKTVLGTMGYSSCTPGLARLMYDGRLRDVVFFGGGFSLPEVEANYANVKLGRSVMAVDVYTGEVLAAKDLTTVSATIGPIGSGLVPFEFFLNSGMAQRAYFTDFYGGLWAWGSKETGNTGAFDKYRMDSSDLAYWTTDSGTGGTARSISNGTNSNAGIRKVAQDGTGVSALYSTLPAPFRVGTFPGAAKVAGSPTPAAVGIALVSGDRNNPLSNGPFTTYVGNTPPPPTLHRATVLFDRQDSRAWGLDTGVGPDVGITDTKLENFSAQNSPTAPKISLGNTSFYLAPSSGVPAFGYYMNMPPAASSFVPKGITEPIVVAGSLFYSYFSPSSADPCLGGSGSTYTRKVCDVLYPIFDDPRPTAGAGAVACKSGQAGFVFVGVASSFATYSTRGVLQAGATAVLNPQPGESATTPVIVTSLGKQQERYPKVRVWRTVR